MKRFDYDPGAGITRNVILGNGAAVRLQHCTAHRSCDRGSQRAFRLFDWFCTRGQLSLAATCLGSFRRSTLSRAADGWVKTWQNLTMPGCVAKRSLWLSALLQNRDHVLRLVAASEIWGTRCGVAKRIGKIEQSCMHLQALQSVEDASSPS